MFSIGFVSLFEAKRLPWRQCAQIYRNRLMWSKIRRFLATPNIATQSGIIAETLIDKYRKAESLEDIVAWRPAGPIRKMRDEFTMSLLYWGIGAR
jgi:hypothetical protein